MTLRILPVILLAASPAFAGGPATPEAAAGKAPVEQIVAGSFSASDPWTGVSADTEGADVYMTLENGGSRSIHIEGVSTPVAKSALLMTADNTASAPEAKMEPHGTMTLQPGGVHIHLDHLTQSLPADSSFPLTFSYNGGALMTTDVNVFSQPEIDTMKKDAESARNSTDTDRYVYRSGLVSRPEDIKEPSIGMSGKNESLFQP